MRILCFALVLLTCASGALAQTPEAIPAEPRWKKAPDYPASCLGAGVDATDEERVDVAFKINADGLTEDVRIMRSTNGCFEDVSISAVRSWVYTPRKVDGRNRPQEDMEATFIFELQTASPKADIGEPDIKTESRALVFDARPIERIPPIYPARCRPKAYYNEYVVLQFDVTINGETENYKVFESTNECFNDSALESVKGWRYEARTIDGVLTDRVDVKTLIIFRNDYGRVRPEDKVRPVILSRLARVRRLIERKKVDDALALIEKIEAKYGDSFSPAELSEFHRMRAMVRIGADDLSGALDDLKAARRLNARDPEGAIQDLIDQLEMMLGVASDQPTVEDDAAKDEPTPE